MCGQAGGSRHLHLHQVQVYGGGKVVFQRLAEPRRLLDHRESAHGITVRVPQGDDMGVAEAVS